MRDRLLYLTDQNDSRTHTEQVEAVCAAGGRWIQLRVKGENYTTWLSIAEEARRITERYDATLTINDNVRIAKEVGADGVHLGRYDMPPIEARQILGEAVHIGGTAHSEEEIEQLLIAGIDYIGIGPFRETATKQNLRTPLSIAGIERLVRYVRSRTESLPVVAIGGIEADDAAALYRAGVSAVAVGGAVRRAPTLENGVQRFFQAIV